MNTIGIALAMLSSSCMFVAMFYANWKYELKKSWKWLGIGIAMLVVAIVITK